MLRLRRTRSRGKLRLVVPTVLLLFTFGACAQSSSSERSQTPLPPSATATAEQLGYKVAWYETPFSQTVGNVSKTLLAQGWTVDGDGAPHAPLWEFSARKDDAQLYGTVVDCDGTFALPDGGVAANCGSLAPAGTRAMVTIDRS